MKTKNGTIYQSLRKKDKKNIKAVKNRCKEKFLACEFNDDMDKRRCGSMSEDLDNDFTFGNDECPTALQKACEHSTSCKNSSPRKNNNNDDNCNNRDGVSFVPTGHGNGNDNNGNGNNDNDACSCHGDRCWGNCDNPNCAVPGSNGNRNDNNNDNDNITNAKWKIQMMTMAMMMESK